MSTDDIAESSTAEAQLQTETDVSQEPESSTGEAVETTEDKTDDQEAEKRDRVQERINKLTREKYEARKHAEEMEKKFREMEERLNGLDKPPAEPNFDDFDSDAEFKAAYRDYVLKTEQHQARQNSVKEAEKQSQEAQQKAALERQQEFSKRAQAEADRYQGYWDAVQDPAFSAIVNTMNPEVIALIQESENSTGLSYHLATNLELADQLANMPLASAARELIKLESGLQKPQPNKLSKAPEPTEPIGSSGSLDVPLEKIESIDEWMKRRNAQVRR